MQTRNRRTVETNNKDNKAQTRRKIESASLHLYRKRHDNCKLMILLTLENFTLVSTILCTVYLTFKKNYKNEGTKI